MISTQVAHIGIAKRRVEVVKRLWVPLFPSWWKQFCSLILHIASFRFIRGLLLFKLLSIVLCTQQTLHSLNEWVNTKGVRVTSEIPSHSCFLWLLTAVSQMGSKCLFAKIPKLLLVPPFWETKYASGWSRTIPLNYWVHSQMVGKEFYSLWSKKEEAYAWRKSKLCPYSCGVQMYEKWNRLKTA